MSLLGKRKKTEGLLLAEELAAVQATDIVCHAMDVSHTSRKALAEVVGVSASEITQRLRGTRNLTMRSLVDMLDALDHELVIDARPRRQTLPASGSSARYVAGSDSAGTQRQ